MSGRARKQTVSFREVSQPSAYLYPCTEEFRSVSGALQTVIIQHGGMQGQFSLTIVHTLKGKTDVPEGFLSGWDDERREVRRAVDLHVLGPTELRLEASPVDR